MLKVAIVDDEYDVRERLTHMLETIDSGFTLTASYENGIDAYNGIINNPPDLLITDLHIPYINGIELIKLIKEAEPFIKVIIITGYDEIDYTKQAIDLEVISFISKPTSHEELTKALRKAKKRIDQEYEINTSLLELKSFKQQNLPIIRENDLHKLITMKQLTPGFQKKLLDEGIDLNYQYVMIGVFDFDQNIEEIDAEIAQNSFLIIKQKIESDFHLLYDYEIFNGDHQLIIILKSHKGFALSEIETYLAVELKRIKRFKGTDISVGFSEVSNQPHHFKHLFLNANKALELRRVIDETKVYFYTNIRDIIVTNKTIDDTEYKNLTYLIKYRPLKEVKEYLEELKTTLVEPEYHASFYFIISNILNTLLQACSNLQVLYEKYLPANQIYIKMTQLKTVEEAFDWFNDVVYHIKQIDEESIDDTIDLNLDQIINYIGSHYMDLDINLTSVSENVNLSPGYISSLLKKQYNLTFVKYLTMLRMEKAKDLLSNPQLKIIDVSEQVGYSDSYYFSHCFKKYYNLSPKEYRNVDKNEKK